MTQNYASSVPTTETSLEVIATLCEKEELRVGEVADRLDIAPSTALRHLKTLEREGYACKQDESFRLGSKFLTLAGYYRTRCYGYQIAETYVEKLVNQTGERAQFMIEENGRRIFLYRRTSDDIIRTRSRLGDNGLLHDTAGGKAILAQMSTNSVESILEEHGLPSTTENTITEVRSLFDELSEIYKQGYATSVEEAQLDYNGLASVVMDPNTGNTLGALSISGPSHRLTEERMHEELSESIVNLAREFELELKYE